MAFASIGTGGTAADAVSSASFALTTVTTAIDASSNRFGILTLVTDNISTADGETSDHTSITGGNGTWSKIAELTNTVGGAAGDGVTVSQWLFTPSGNNAAGTVFTINVGTACVDKTASLWVFSKGSGTIVRQTPDYPIQTDMVDDDNDFGLGFYAIPTTKERLWFASYGKEANSTTQIRVSTEAGGVDVYTAITPQRSRNNAAAVLVRGEFIIYTAGTELAFGGLSVIGDAALIFTALEEAQPYRTPFHASAPFLPLLTR